MTTKPVPIIPNLPWRKIFIALLAWLFLYVLFDIPNRFFYQEKGWNIPTDPREKAAYDFAHSLQIPPNPPQGGFKYLKVNEHFDHGKAVSKDNPPLIETIIPKVPQPQAFNFVWARIKSLLWLDEPVRVQYFKHLCDTEAGEYIYKTVDKVEGIYQMRPMPKRSQALMKDRYGFEDPADWTDGESDMAPLTFVDGSPQPGFAFFESIYSPSQALKGISLTEWFIEVAPDENKTYFWHYFDHDSRRNIQMKVKPINKPLARYAYTWRGLQRKHDRENGIAGGEMFILDLQTNKVLGYRRSFAFSKIKSFSLNWEFAYFCPASLRMDGKKRVVEKLEYPFSFISQVLVPINFDKSQIHYPWSK